MSITTRSPASISSYSNWTVSHAPSQSRQYCRTALRPVVDVADVEDVALQRVPFHVRVQQLDAEVASTGEKVLSASTDQLRVLLRNKRSPRLQRWFQRD